MKKGMKVTLTLILLVTLLFPLISSTGTCQLDKEIYHPGETATFSCACSQNNEKNQVGYIVFMNSSGDILQSSLTTSSNCKSSIFGDSFIFPSSADYLGNATFSANADGSGTPTNWNGAGDIISDTFNVSGAGIHDCIIVNITGSAEIKVGGVGAVEFKVKDPITDQALIHANCRADGYDINGAPLVFEPMDSGHQGDKISTANGEVGFIHEMDEEFWETSTTYLWEFHCFALPPTVDVLGDHVGFLENGTPSGMKSCFVQSFFTTAGEDIRETNIPAGDSIVYSLLTIAMLLLFLGTLMIQIKMPFKDKIDSKGASVLIPKLKYVKVMMTLVTYPLFVYFLNFLIVISDLMRVTVFSNFIEFLFLVLMSLSIPVFWFTIVLTGFLIFKDWKVQDTIKRFGSAIR